MKGKLVTGLFAIPFAAFGAWMLWLVVSEAYTGWQASSWIPVEATLSDAGYRSSSGDDSDTYEAYATYSYYFNGQSYSGNRVSISAGADNIGDYQSDTGNRLRREMQAGNPITVYVDPGQPDSSLIDPHMRWGMLAFKSIFVLIFGGVGFGLLFATFFMKAKAEDALLPEHQEAPWLANDAWQTATIRSNSKSAMWVALGFAAFWNLISAPLPFVLYEEITEKQNYVASIGLLFPLVGIGLLVWAFRRSMEWRRFGPAPVTLDPFPGAIGGHVGGTIDLNMPFSQAARFQVTLSSIKSYISGSGKDRSRRESADWQDKMVANAEPGASGTRLVFRFDVPDNLRESDAQRASDTFHLWRLNVHAELDGVDIDRDYEIPVYATAQMSRHLSAHSVDKGRAEQSRMDQQAIRRVVDIQNGLYGKELFFPMGRMLGAALAGVLFGAVFGGAGWFLIVHEGARVFGGVFALVGGLIGLFGLYSMFNSLHVSHDSMSIRTVRRILGVAVKRREMRRDSFVKLHKKSSMQSQSGGKHTVYYSVYAVDRQDNKIVLGEGFKGANEADAAIRLIGQELGLADILAADA
ncbi:MAG: DUF3592 domain-containing protein [Woeseiaceae bacterium]